MCVCTYKQIDNVSISARVLKLVYLSRLGVEMIRWTITLVFIVLNKTK